MPKITPLASVPTTTPDLVAAASVLFMPPGAELWVEGQVTAGTVSLRPYYWSDDLSAVTVLKGAWIPVGGDAISGTSPVSFDVADFGGAAQGSYPWRSVLLTTPYIFRRRRLRIQCSRCTAALLQRPVCAFALTSATTSPMFRASIRRHCDHHVHTVPLPTSNLRFRR